MFLFLYFVFFSLFVNLFLFFCFFVFCFFRGADAGPFKTFCDFVVVFHSYCLGLCSFIFEVDCWIVPQLESMMYTPCLFVLINNSICIPLFLSSVLLILNHCLEACPESLYQCLFGHENHADSYTKISFQIHPFLFLYVRHPFET